MTDDATPTRRCPVCDHPSVLGINTALLNGKSYRAIARDYRIGSEKSGEFRPDHKKVMRHMEGCMASSYQQVTESNLTVQGQAISARLKFLDEQVDVAIEDALLGEPLMIGDTPMLDDDGKPKMIRSVAHVRALLAAVREGRQNAALTAKLAGAMPEQDQSALEQSRLGLEDPAIRRVVQQVEELLAEKAEREGRNALEL